MVIDYYHGQWSMVTEQTKVDKGDFGANNTRTLDQEAYGTNYW